MKKIIQYFISGFLLLIPLFIVYQLVLIISSVVTVFYTSNLLIDLAIAVVSITLTGFLFATFFKSRIRKRIKSLAKKPTFFGYVAAAFVNFDHISNKAKKAFHNPVLYKVDDGIYKLGFITDEDLDILATNPDEESNTEAIPAEGSVWIYTPTPINFFGSLSLVEQRKIRRLSAAESERIPLFVLSGGLIEKLD